MNIFSFLLLFIFVLKLRRSVTTRHHVIVLRLKSNVWLFLTTCCCNNALFVCYVLSCIVQLFTILTLINAIIDLTCIITRRLFCTIVANNTISAFTKFTVQRISNFVILALFFTWCKCTVKTINQQSFLLCLRQNNFW